MNAAIEIWASPEPTIARIEGAAFRNQLLETGHAQRDEDVELLASLGVSATRYPVLWEQVAPVDPRHRDFRWTDRRLQALAAHGIEPIVTLVHHGSGPAYTELLDPCFPQLLEDYALAVARRYPWVRRWTPINEPLTTARFSTLYAAWHPNRYFDHPAFGRAIVHEALGIVLAMRAIRQVIPEAELVLTEDLQRFVAADAAIAEYVRHKAERRFLSAELIMGRVDRNHELWPYLTQTCEVPARDLESLRWFALPVDLMGWNYYPNSERILYSVGKGQHRNVGLVDVAPEQLEPRRLLAEAAARLGVPTALAEVHALGNDQERARWMLQRFADAQAVRADGADLRAFGAWAAFGLVDWVSLLRRREEAREDGIFTCVPADRIPEPTLVADVVRALARGEVPATPEQLGWWERSDEVA